MTNSVKTTYKPYLIIGLVLIAGYFTNIFVGKASLSLGASQPVHLGDVTEFLLLLFSIISLVIFVVNNNYEKQQK